MENQIQTIEQIKASALDMLVKFGPKLLVALIILVVGWLVAGWLGKIIQRFLERFSFEAPVRTLLVRVGRVAVMALFLILALQNLGVELLPLIAGLGVMGAGAALAMQGFLANLVAGLTIIFTQPYRVGHYLSIGNEEGEVIDISLFSTILGHPDRSHVVIPNRKIVGEILHNYGYIRQLNLVVNIAYDSDVSLALKLVNEIVAANSLVLADPVPCITVVRLGESGIALGVFPWVKVPDYITASGEINQAILEAFRAHKIAMALPQREVRLLGKD
ncbi:MAG: MscS Mechanosensitive ion channel:Conserved helix [Proteobacteria bacterium]|nr:MscS Mechanosensitive ion channel:Conserved helix [Pseudomonadota bacterium]